MNIQTAPKGDLFSNKESIVEYFKNSKYFRGVFNRIVLSATIFLLVAGAALVYYLQPDFYSFNQSRINSPIGVTFFVLTTAILLFKLLFIVYNVYLYFQYKPVESVSDELLPKCTVIVPAYNEGNLVYQTLLSIAGSDFPQHKLQILAIDDGSKDDTWYWMQKAKQELGDQITVFQQPSNKGKRHALYRGFNLGTGEVFVTIDSDSIIKTDTLRNLVSPFITDESCGAVAGNVRVLNNKNVCVVSLLIVLLFLFYIIINKIIAQI